MEYIETFFTAPPTTAISTAIILLMIIKFIYERVDKGYSRKKESIKDLIIKYNEYTQNPKDAIKKFDFENTLSEYYKKEVGHSEFNFFLGQDKANYQLKNYLKFRKYLRINDQGNEIDEIHKNQYLINTRFCKFMNYSPYQFKAMSCYYILGFVGLMILLLISGSTEISNSIVKKIPIIIKIFFGLLGFMLLVMGIIHLNKASDHKEARTFINAYKKQQKP